MRILRGGQRSRLLGVMGLSVILAACGSPTGSTTQTQPPDRALIEYVIEVHGSADVTYATANGGTEQMSRVKSGVVLSSEFPAGGLLYLSAQVNDRASRVSCTIKSDGQVVSSNESVGDFVIASCEGSAAPCPECRKKQASAGNWVPYGFRAWTDSTVAYRFLDTPESCESGSCIPMEVVSQKACPRGILVDGRQLNAAGGETGTDVDRTDPLEAGEIGRVTLRWESRPDDGKVEILKVVCVGS